MALLEVKNLTKHFGGLAAVQDVSFDLQEGQIFTLIGPNGAGKTTTFNMIAGSFPATAGSVKYDGIELLGKRPEDIVSLGISRTYQITAVFFGLTVFENLLIACHSIQKSNLFDTLLISKRYKREEREIHERAKEVLEFVGLTDYRDELANSLPYGLQRLLEIAIALACKPRFVLLDEPAAGLNPEETRMLMNLIRKIRDSGITILLIEHNMGLVMDISDRILCLDHGIILAEGEPNEISQSPKVIEAYLGRGDTE